MSQKFKILALTSDPTDTARLRLGKEMRVIREYLRASEYRDRIELFERHAVRPSDIVQAFFEVEPNVVHFSGHGTKYGELCFEDEMGKTSPVDPSAAEALFERFAGHIICVVLNSCYSEVQAKAIAKSVKYVVGMNDAIGDEGAVHFAGGFYRALGAGQSIEESFQFGLVEFHLHGIGRMASYPVLIRNPTVTPRHVLVRPQSVTLPNGFTLDNYPDIPDCAKIYLGDEDRAAVYVNPEAYATFGELIDELFAEYLSARFPVYSYGDKWVLVTPRSSRIPAPLEWVERAPCALRELNTDSWKYSTTLKEQLVTSSSVWRIHEISPDDRFYGIALKTEHAMRECLRRAPKEPLPPLHKFEEVRFRDIDESEYAFRLVLLAGRYTYPRLRSLSESLGGRIWAETKPLPKRRL